MNPLYAIRRDLASILRRTWSSKHPSVPMITLDTRAKIEVPRPWVNLFLEVAGPMPMLMPVADHQGRPGACTVAGWRVTADVSAVTAPDFEEHEGICSDIRAMMDNIVADQQVADELFRIDSCRHAGEQSDFDTDNGYYLTSITYDLVVAYRVEP